MYQFTEDCLTGIEQIDEEHRRLFAIINDTYKLLNEKDGSVQGAKNLVLALKRYAEEHFAHEETYMNQIQDPELLRQKMEHEEFKKKVNSISLENLGEEDGRNILLEFMEFLTRWLYHHILGSDIMIGKMGNAEENKKDPFAFTKEYWTGIEIVDQEHKRLFEIIKETNDVIHAEFLHDKYDEIVRILSELSEYTVLHFRDEENYMEKIGYKRLDIQKRAHESFVERLKQINLEEMDDNQEEYLEELIQFLLNWLANHILKMDKMIPVEILQ